MPLASCGPDETTKVSPADKSRIYLVVDADALPSAPETAGSDSSVTSKAPAFPGCVHRVDLSTGEATVFARDPRFVDPQRILRDDRGGFFLVDFDADPDRRGGDTAAIFRLSSTGEVIEVHSPHELIAPTAALLREDGVLLVSDRRTPAIGNDDPPRESADTQGALFAIDFDRGTCEVVTQHPTFRAPADLIDIGGGQLLLLDADTRGTEKGSEGAFFRIDAMTGEVLDVRRLRGTISPLGALLAPNGDLIVFDVNADPRALGGPLGALFRLPAKSADNPVESEGLQLIASAPKYFRDPVRGLWLADGALLVVDANSDPHGRGPDAAGRGQNLTGGGALLRVDPTTQAVSVLAAPTTFVNPVDVLELR